MSVKERIKLFLIEFAEVIILGLVFFLGFVFGAVFL